MAPIQIFTFSTTRNSHFPFLSNAIVHLVLLHLCLECIAHQEDIEYSLPEYSTDDKKVGSNNMTSYEDFLTIYGRAQEINYSNSNYLRRKEIFDRSQKNINEANNDKQSDFYKGINQFSDLSLEEKLFYLTGMRMSKPVRVRLSRLNWQAAKESRIVCSGDAYFDDYNDRLGNQKKQTGFNDRLPDSFTWLRTKLSMSPKNQGRCGVSWAFAAAGILEAQLERQHSRQSTQLSAQQLIDCSKSKSCLSGGTAFEALDMVDRMNGIMTEHDIPYRANKTVEGRFVCQFNRRASLARKINHGLCVPPPDDHKSMERFLIQHGPIAVPIHTTEGFFDYKNGTFVDETCDPSQVNHELLFVGFGSELNPKKSNSTTRYWILKNSWGTSWGENGFVKILPGSCGTNSYFTSALIQK